MPQIPISATSVISIIIHHEVCSLLAWSTLSNKNIHVFFTSNKFIKLVYHLTIWFCICNVWDVWCTGFPADRRSKTDIMKILKTSDNIDILISSKTKAISHFWSLLSSQSQNSHNLFFHVETMVIWHFISIGISNNTCVNALITLQDIQAGFYIQGNKWMQTLIWPIQLSWYIINGMMILNHRLVKVHTHLFHYNVIPLIKKSVLMGMH